MWNAADIDHIAEHEWDVMMSSVWCNRVVFRSGHPDRGPQSSFAKVILIVGHTFAVRRQFAAAWLSAKLSTYQLTVQTASPCRGKRVLSIGRTYVRVLLAQKSYVSRLHASCFLYARIALRTHNSSQYDT